MLDRVLPRIEWHSLLFGVLAIVAGLASVVIVEYVPDVNYLLLTVGAAVVALLIVQRVEWGLLVLVFTTYIRFSSVMRTYHGAPPTIHFLILLIVVGIFIRWIFRGRQPSGWERVALLLGSYGLVNALSLFFAVNYSAARHGVVNLMEDVLLTISVVILLQTSGALRRVIWMLVAAGIFLGTLSVYQYLTGTFSENYGGFAQVEYANIVGRTSDYRIGGPSGSPNFFAQAMIVLVPLALDRMWNEKSIWLRVLAGWGVAVSALTVIFTFSRGGFLALSCVLILLMIVRPPRLTVLPATLAVCLVLVQFLPAKYIDRLLTLTDLFPNSNADIRNEGSFRGHLSENIVAWMMFVEHPILGVGTDQYEHLYLNYSERLGIDPRSQDRVAHNVYLEIAAEHGVVGFGVFCAILWIMFRGLWLAREDFLAVGKPDKARIAIVFGVAMIGYLLCGMFIGLAYANTFWMLVGIALAIPQIARRELDIYRQLNASSNSKFAIAKR